MDPCKDCGLFKGERLFGSCAGCDALSAPTNSAQGPTGDREAINLLRECKWALRAADMDHNGIDFDGPNAGLRAKLSAFFLSRGYAPEPDRDDPQRGAVPGSGLTGSLVERIARRLNAIDVRDHGFPLWARLSVEIHDEYRNDARGIIALFASETEPPSDTELLSMCEGPTSVGPWASDLRALYDYATARANARFEVERAELLKRAELAELGRTNAQASCNHQEKRVAELEAELAGHRAAWDLDGPHIDRLNALVTRLGPPDSLGRSLREVACEIIESTEKRDTELMAALEKLLRRRHAHGVDADGGGQTCRVYCDDVATVTALIKAHRESGAR